METLEDLNTKCKAKQAATTDYVSDLLKRITGAFCAEWDEYEQKLQENSATDPKSPANSLKNEPSIPGTEASSSVAAALSILRNFVLVESTIPMEVDPDLSPTTIVKPTKTKSLTGTTRLVLVCSPLFT